MVAEFDVPLGIGAVLQVDTSREVDVPALAVEVRRVMGDECWGQDVSPLSVTQNP
jgi:hypothetical protein